MLLDKPGRDPTTSSAYRPICLLGVEGKLFERVITSRIEEHLSSGGTTFLRISKASGRAVQQPTHSTACAPESGTLFIGTASQ